MIRSDADVVLPGRSFQLHGLGGSQRAGGVPFADAQEDSLAVIDRTTVTRSVVDTEQDPPAVSGHPVYVRRDRDGQSTGELFRLQEPRVLRRDPSFRQGEDR